MGRPKKIKPVEGIGDPSLLDGSIPADPSLHAWSNGETPKQPALVHVPEANVEVDSEIARVDPDIADELRRSNMTQIEVNKMRKVILKMYQRRIESLKLYEPMVHQDPFHHSHARERTLRGSNRAGKTLVAAVEIARVLTNQDPFMKYPEANGRIFAVAKNEKEIGEVMYRKLFRAGAFQIIRDLKDGIWRVYRPWSDDDKDRAHLAKPAPPLVPPRMVRETAWAKKVNRIPGIVRMKNGWEISFFSSLSAPPRGADVDVAWFDEEIIDPEWYVEMAARLMDRKGVFIWSATPQAGSNELYDLSKKSEEQRGTVDPKVLETFLHIKDNPYVPEEAKADFASKLLSDEDRRVRIEGEFAVASFKVYPEYSPLTHGCEPFIIPPSWTFRLYVDPGRQVCAVMFVAVPPPIDPDYGQHVYLYDELYIKSCSAEKFAIAVCGKSSGRNYHSFIIDHQMSRVTDMGSGLMIEDQYSAALKKQGIKSRATGYGFKWGVSDVAAGIESVRGMLQIQQDGKPKLQVFRGRLPNFEWEMERYRFLKVKGILTDKPDQRNNHLIDGLRYAAMDRLDWYPPVKVTKKPKGAYKSFLDKKKKAALRARKGSSEFVSLG